jgi:hypothetical protein
VTEFGTRSCFLRWVSGEEFEVPICKDLEVLLSPV